jgi:hypothetical protein
MTMYNLLFGKNSESNIFLKMIGRNENDFGRFRDVSLDEKNRYIIVTTRDGGNNRRCHKSFDDEYSGEDCPEGSECSGCVMTNIVPTYEFYVKDKDDSYDCTYADVYFKIPEKYKNLTQIMLDGKDYTNDPLYLELKKN